MTTLKWLKVPPEPDLQIQDGVRPRTASSALGKPYFLVKKPKLVLFLLGSKAKFTFVVLHITLLPKHSQMAQISTQVCKIT